MLDDSFVKKLATDAVGFEISVTDGEGLEIEFDIPSLKSNRPSFSDNWKKAYIQLENNEQIDKSVNKTEDEFAETNKEEPSLLKKLFSFFK